MRIRWILAAVTLLATVSSPAWAIVVTNSTTASTLFADNGFEDDTVGTNPNAPFIGTWIKPVETTTGATVINDVAPGSYLGSNYLRIARNGAPNTAQMDAIFDQALTTGDTMNVEFAFLYESTGSSSVNFQLRSGTSLVGGIYAEPDFAAPNFYSLDGNLSGEVDSSLAVTPGTWQTIGIQYTAGSSDMTLTVNGVSELLAGAVTAGDVDRIRFTTAAGGTTYYLDASVAVASPATLTWGSDTGGDWNEGAFWSPHAVPNGNNNTAVLGDVITAPRTIFSDQDISLKTLNIDNANSYAVAGTGTLTFAADTGNATINVNQGTHQFQLNVGLANNADVDIAAGATLEFNNRLNLGGKTLTKLGDGALKINNDLNTGGGSIVVMAGSVGGGGSIAGSLTNSGGTVGPGNSPGTLSVQGAYTQSAGGTLAIELAGLAAGTQYDRLVVDGAATLSGTLAVSLLGGFSPNLGDSFEVMTFASHSGEFNNYTGLDLGGHLALKAAYSATDLSLNARPAIDGDINLDGTVNIFDINSVSSNWGTAGPQGDANGDHIVNIFDVNLVSANWGATGGGATAVPEPSSWMLLTLGAMVGLWGRRRFGRIGPQT
jgi:PEP-CTERM motif